MKLLQRFCASARGKTLVIRDIKGTINLALSPRRARARARSSRYPRGEKRESKKIR